MKKNIVLIILAIVASIIIGILYILPPKYLSLSKENSYTSTDALHVDEDIKISYNQYNNSPSGEEKESIKNSSNESYKKYTQAFLSQDNLYKITIISEGSKGDNSSQYRTVEGKISDKRIVMNIPLEIAADIKARIIVHNLKTNEKTEIDNGFLKQIQMLQPNEHLIVEIDTATPSNVFVSSKEIISILPGPK